MLPKIVFFNIVQSLFFIPFLTIAFLCSIIARFKSKKNNKPRLVWGSTPIINYSYWSKAMKRVNYNSETFTKGYYTIINKRDDWDKIIEECYQTLPYHFRGFFAFLESLFKYDVFVISFDGFFIGNTLFENFQAQIMKIAKKKVIILPYGSDSYSYKMIRSTSLIHGLIMSYPEASRKQKYITNKVDYWCKYADAVITGIMGPDGFGRWDVLTPSPFCIDLDQWKPSLKKNLANGIDDRVVIAHAPNHRGFKGTEFIIQSIEKLKSEGLLIELILIEKKQNTEVKRILCEETDILVEQLIATGHGFNALEGMASGITVISNLEDDAYLLPMRRWSFFSECPIVSATPETLTDVLRKLVTRPELRCQLGRVGREYVEKYHGFDSAQYLFSNVIDYVYGRKESLINLYHPLLGEYPNRSPKIKHPLVNNRIID